MTREEAIRTTVERRNWLTERIKAKQAVGWDIAYDTRERDAHTTLLELIEELEAR